jgi:hypothetical protein
VSWLLGGLSELSVSLRLDIIRTFLIGKPLLVLSVDEVVEDVRAGRVELTGNRRTAYMFWWGKVIENHLDHLCVCERMLLKCKAKE